MIVHEIDDYQEWYHKVEQLELEAAYIAAYNVVNMIRSNMNDTRTTNRKT